MAPAVRRAGCVSFYYGDPAAPGLAELARLTRAGFERCAREGLLK